MPIIIQKNPTTYWGIAIGIAILTALTKNTTSPSQCCPKSSRSKVCTRDWWLLICVKFSYRIIFQMNIKMKKKSMTNICGGIKCIWRGSKSFIASSHRSRSKKRLKHWLNILLKSLRWTMNYQGTKLIPIKKSKINAYFASLTFHWTIRMCSYSVSLSRQTRA